jgi:hypothetical protein
MPGPQLGWIGLNPSIADEQREDPTIRREVDFSKRFGFAGMAKGNLYPLVATYPLDLWRHTDPIGPGGDDELVAVMKQCSGVVLAWGRLPSRAVDRAKHVIRTLVDNGIGPLWVLCLTKCGQYPRHPLYLRKDCQLQPPPSSWHGGKAF